MFHRFMTGIAGVWPEQHTVEPTQHPPPPHTQMNVCNESGDWE